VARVTSLGGWLDLRARRLAPPPPGLAEALRAMPRAEDFAEIPVRSQEPGPRMKPG
jgi:acyl-CoA thioester hydrolase